MNGECFSIDFAPKFGIIDQSGHENEAEKEAEKTSHGSRNQHHDVKANKGEIHRHLGENRKKFFGNAF